MKKNLLILLCSFFVFTSCSSKNDLIEYNKPAMYWYNKMIDKIAFGDLDKADDVYTSLESEHRNSPLIPTALMILINAHIDQEEYSLANFYLDEYIKRFALSKDIDYMRYLKIKANFLGFAYEFRDQELIENTIKEIAQYKMKYPKSQYMPLVDTMNARLYMAKASLDKEIADLYKRKGKKKASEYYEKKVKSSWVNMKEVKPANTPLYRKIFE